MTGREILWNIGGRGVVWLFAAAACSAFAYGAYRRCSMWRRGRPAGRFGRAWTRATSTLGQLLGHGRIVRGGRAGRAHLPIFWGMATLFAGTIVVALQADLGIRLLQGGFYLGFKLAMDTAGLAVLAGLGACAHRRYLGKDEDVDNRTEDAAVLALLAGVVVSGFVVEGLRIASTGDPTGAWSPAGNILAGVFRGAGGDGLVRAHRIGWLAHASLSFGLIACLPFSKLIHVVTAPLNIFFRPLTPPGALDRLDLEDDAVTRFGAGALDDFTWKDLLDTDACIRCARCQAACPAHATAKPLSPMKLIGDLRAHMAGGGRDGGGAAARRLVGDVIEDDALWACTTCGSCMERCPVLVEHVPKIVGMRRSLVLMESRFPPELNPLFRNLENAGNPWGLSRTKRGDWAKGLDVDVVGKGGTPEYLYWVGCAGSFDDRNARVAEAMVGILRHAGIRFAILGPEERCCGDSARRLGNEYLFQSLVQGNVRALRGHGIKKIVTQCPHCFNTLKNEYPQFGGNYDVIHHTELISGLIGKGIIRAGDGGGGTVTYQDPCYMGRHNGVYRAPREIIANLGLRLAEMRGHREEGFCCGAGGGRMWMEERLGERINVRRTEDALAVDAEAVLTACPYCLAMMEDGVKVKGGDGTARTMDIAELVIDSIRRRSDGARGSAGSVQSSP